MASRAAAPRRPEAHHATTHHATTHQAEARATTAHHPATHRATVHRATAHHVVRHAPERKAVHEAVLPASPHAAQWLSETGIATYYANSHRGHRMAEGERYDPQALTAAHAWLPFGTRVRVRLVGTDRSVVVVITDRPGARHSVIDLSYAAARELGIVHMGVAKVVLSPD